jgi:dienelactone hydrolase
MCHPEAPEHGAPTPPVREEVTIPLPSGEGMPALLAGPGGQAPGVVIVPDIFGRIAFYESLAERLAAAGLYALLPDPFWRLGPLPAAEGPEKAREAARARRRRLDDRLALDDLSAAIDWLRGRPEVQGDRLGTIGFCMGGTYVLNLAAERDDLATVCYYGFPAGGNAGQPNPAPAPIDQAGTVSGPILGFWGDQDAGVGMDNVERYTEALRARGVDLDRVIYPGLGHGFLRAAFQDAQAHGHQDAVGSWERALAFWREHLPG